MAVESWGSAGEEERGLEDLAGRLREDSVRLAARYPARAFCVQEVMRLRSTQRRRTVAVRAAAALLFVAGGAWTWTALTRPSDERPRFAPPPIASTDPESKAPAQEGVASPVPNASDDALPAQAALAWRFVITSADAQGGRRVVATGVYIPERSREVTFDELSPAEQYAVRRALGSDHKPQWQL